MKTHYLFSKPLTKKAVSEDTELLAQLANLKLQQDDVSELRYISGNKLNTALDAWLVATDHCQESNLMTKGVFTVDDQKLHGIYGFTVDRSGAIVSPWFLHNGFVKNLSNPVYFQLLVIRELLATLRALDWCFVINKAWKHHGSLKWLKHLGFDLEYTDTDVVFFHKEAKELIRHLEMLNERYTTKLAKRRH